MKHYPNPIFYGLLYIDKEQKENPNIKGKGTPFDIYLRCANLCAKSVAYHGYKFRLVTNDKSQVEARLRLLGAKQIDVLEQKFTLIVPGNLKFRAAHFKLELYRLLGSGSYGNEVGVIDIDSVMTGPINFPSFSPETLLAYDITNQVCEDFGRTVVCSDLERLIGRNLSECRWFGGEFIFGNAESFRSLAASVFKLWPKYIENVSDLHHVGDEMIVAAAIVSSNLTVIDGGKLGFVARWWTARTNFKQLPFQDVVGRSILHLPSDKQFLAKISEMEFCPEDFTAQFKREARGKLFRRRLFNMAQMLLPRRRKYVGDLW